MKNKLLKLLLEEDVTFTKVDPEFCNTKGYTIQGFSCMSQHVLGNSKEEILQKMYDIKQEQKKEFKKYNLLPYLSDFLEDIRNGKLIYLNRHYTVRKTEETNSYPTLTKTGLGREWLKELFYEMYFEIDYTKDVLETETGFSFSLKRNSTEIDNLFWDKHKKLIEEWLLKN